MSTSILADRPRRNSHEKCALALDFPRKYQTELNLKNYLITIYR